MDKDGKLIFEQYKNYIVYEASALAGPLYATGAAGAGAASTILGGLFVIIDDISKWAYSQSAEGKRVQFTNEINSTYNKIKEIKNVANNLDVATQSKNFNTLIQNLRISTNILMSSNDQNVIRLGQN